MKSRISNRAAWILAAVSIPLAGIPAAANPFQDVSGPLAIEASALAQRNILPPVWGSQLAPYAPIYRYEEAWMLAALLDPRDHPFIVIAWPDVPPGYWALQAVNQVVGIGILHDEAGRFNGDREVRRGEFVQALDQVLTYRAIPPPPPRHGEIRFSDVHGPLAGAVYRAANRWQFLSRSDRFRPDAILTRGEAIAMLAKAAPLIDPSFAQLLVLPPTPTPIPTPTPGSRFFFPPTQPNAPPATPTPVSIPARTTPPPSNTPSPAAPTPVSAPSPPTITLPGLSPIVLPPSAQPSDTVTPAPVSGTGPATATAATAASPEPQWTLPPIAWHWQAAPVLASFGFADSSILQSNPAYFAPGGADLDLSGLSGAILGTVQVGTHMLPGSGAGLYQVFGGGQGLWMMNLAPGTAAGVGGGIVLNSQFVNASPAPVTAPAADRTFFGIGPAGLLRYDLGFAIVDLALQMQIGGVSGATGGAGFGMGYQVQAYGPIGLGSLDLSVGLRGQLVDPSSGAYDFVSGLVAGLGGNF